MVYVRSSTTVFQYPPFSFSSAFLLITFSLVHLQPFFFSSCLSLFAELCGISSCSSSIFRSFYCFLVVFSFVSKCSLSVRPFCNLVFNPFLQPFVRSCLAASVQPFRRLVQFLMLKFCSGFLVQLLQSSFFSLSCSCPLPSSFFISSRSLSARLQSLSFSPSLSCFVFCFLSCFLSFL